MLIEDPHDLGRIHGRAAAQGDDHVGLEGRHALGALSGAGEGRVVGHVKEAAMFDAQFLQLPEDRLGRPGLVQVRAGHDEGALFAHLAQLLEGNGQAALLDVDLFRRTEPEHVFPSFHHGFDIQQMLDAHVLRHRVAAPGAAAQRQRRREGKVIEIADAAVGGGRVDYDAAGLHPGLEGFELVLLRGGIEIDGGGVAQAAALHESLRLVHRVGKIFGPIHGEDGGKLFVGKLLGLVGGLHLADEDLGALGDLDPGESRDPGSGLAHDAGVDRAVDDDGFPHFIQRLPVEEEAAAPCKLPAHLVVNALVHDDRLLRGADHAIIKGLGVDDGVDCQQDIRRVVDDCGDVARSDAESRGAGGIGGVDHAGPAGGQDDVRLLHEKTGHLTGRGADPADDVLRSTSRDRSFQHDLGGLYGAALGAVVGADDDAVAGFQRQQRFENSGGSGVRRGDDGAYEAQGLGDLLHTVGLVLLDDTAGFGVAIGIIHILRGKVVFDDLILHDAHSGLGDRGLRQRDPGLVRGSRCGKENPVHLLLCIGGVDSLRGLDPCNLLLKRFQGVNIGIFSVHNHQLLFGFVKILTYFCAYINCHCVRKYRAASR